MNGDNRLEQMTINVEPLVAEKLRTLALATNRSINSHVRCAVSDYLREHDEVLQVYAAAQRLERTTHLDPRDVHLRWPLPLPNTLGNTEAEALVAVFIVVLRHLARPDVVGVLTRADYSRAVKEILDDPEHIENANLRDLTRNPFLRPDVGFAHLAAKGYVTSDVVSFTIHPSIVAALRPWIRAREARR